MPYGKLLKNLMSSKEEVSRNVPNLKYGNMTNLEKTGLNKYMEHMQVQRRQDQMEHVFLAKSHY